MGLLKSKIKCGSIAVPHYYLSRYLPLLAGKHTISLSLLKFKQRIQPDLDAWVACAVESLCDLAIPNDTIIIRALRHDETSVRSDFPSSLDILGETLALQLHCRYQPGLLAKTRPTLPNKYLSRGQRRSQLAGVYYIPSKGPAPDKTSISDNPSNPLPPNTPFLLIDDILTTGTTMRALIRTLRESYPACPLKIFTLTRADDHISIPPMPPEDDPRTLDALKKRIIANTV